MLDPEGSPLAGARVTPVLLSIRGEKRVRTVVEQTAVTDALGRFRVEGIPRGSTCYLVACRWDRAPMWHESIELPPAGHARSMEIRLPGWGALEARVAGHAGAPVLVKRELPPCLEEDSDARCLLDAYTGAMTDAAGRFEFERITPGSHRITLFPGNGEVDGGRVSIREGAKAYVEVP